MIRKERYKPLILNIIRDTVIFKQLFNSYCNIDDKARPIKELIAEFERNGNLDVKSACSEDTLLFSAIEWIISQKRRKMFYKIG